MTPSDFKSGDRLKRASWGEFVAVPENRSALLAARRLVDSLLHSAAGSKPTPTPLVLHGPTGSGKSLLVQTLVRKLIDSPTGLTVQVVPARELSRDEDDLKDYRLADLLAIEDLQRLSPRAAGDFVRLLDYRSARRRPTVVTSSVGPALLKGLPRRLTSRLAAGLVVQLRPLSRPSRRQLLAHVATKRKLRLTDDALDWLAARPSGGGVRPLLGMVETLSVLGQKVMGGLDEEAVRELLASGHPTNHRGRVPTIVATVAAAFGVKLKDMLGNSRQRVILVPRQVAMFLARDVGKLSLPQIGSAFKRDHTTVLHACRRVKESMKGDAKLRRTVRDLRASLA